MQFEVREEEGHFPAWGPGPSEVTCDKVLSDDVLALGDATPRVIDYFKLHR